MFSLLRMRAFYRKVLPAVLVLGFLTAVLAGCSNGTVGDDDVNVPGTLPLIMVGKWVSFDAYIITQVSPGVYTLEYDDNWGGAPYGFGYKGNIRFVSNYDSKSGIIIVEYISGQEPSGDYTPGKDFLGIYYRELSSTSVEFANTAILVFPYGYVAAATLQEAIGKFTKGQMGNYVGSFPTFTFTP